MKDLIDVTEDQNIRWGEIANRRMRRYADKIMRELIRWYPHLTPSELAKMTMERLYNGE